MNGKTVLITGGSSGIGKATAIAFAQRGANVVIASRNEDNGAAAAADIRAQGGEVTWVCADVSKLDDVKAMVEITVSTYGSLDYAFNNGGVGGKADKLADIEEVEFITTVRNYLVGTFYCMKYQLGQMLDQGAGVIVNNASVDGLVGFGMDPAYAAAKHGVVGLTKSAAIQYADKGIRINAVCPSWVRTPRIEKRIEADPALKDEILSHQPIGRLGEPEEIAALVLWLCDEAASLVTGTAIPVDGGYTAM